MKILYEQLLVDQLQKLMKASTERIWIASPYIGGISAISRVLGNKWQTPSEISVRLLTDLSVCSQISFKTLETFFKSGKVNTLRGLHAKIYVIDDSVIIASANLTETAFSRRYEMGVLLEGQEAKEAIARFDLWWKEKSTPVSLQMIKEIESRCAPEPTQPQDGNGLANLWNLPPQPNANPISSGQGKLGDFDFFVECYKHLSGIYTRRCQRIAPNIPIFLEIDGLLDYLFHHDGQPSYEYARTANNTILPPRTITNIDAEIIRCAENYNRWVDAGNDISWRWDRSQIIQNLLSHEAVLLINRKGLREVLDCLNCMNSRPGNKEGFLKPENNKLIDIRRNLNMLLHGEDDIKIRMVRCKKALKHFGDSSVQELVGFYFPDQYPLRNGNSNAGLRYFGYDVSI
ncbi:MAG: phospholipase D-like domain-containing protein [Methylococcales bacterium]|nr:phospholipase D-like domain-containing protein [Methylococcales bacterium]